jgi:serine/threonine-protein kinase
VRRVTDVLPIDDAAAPRPDARTVIRRSGDAATDPTMLGAPSSLSGAEAATAPQRFGRYELKTVLGRGAMGTVYRAFDTQLKREVALKLLRMQPGESRELERRFRLEAEAAARLRHPNLVAVFDLGTEGGQPYLTMELLEGGSLAHFLSKRGGKLPPHEAMRLARDVALGLACAHEKGIVHRDLKPENILLEREGTETPCPKISDFGLAQALGGRGDARLTVHGTILGTPAYMAPEQAEGDLDRVDARSDVYALGTVLYEAATGKAAYAGKDPMGVIFEKLKNDPPPPRGLGRDLETIIAKAMAREPERRYAHAGEMADDLDRCLTGAAILARPESAMEGTMRRLRRNRGLAAAVSVVALCLAVAGAAAWRSALDRKEQKRLEEEALGFLRSVAETNLHASLALRRAGLPVAAQEPFLARVEAAARQAAARGPASPEPHYRLGRAYRALQRFDAALEEQNLAVAKDAAYAPARYERALLDLRRWERRLAELRAAWTREEGRRLAQSGELESVASRPKPPSDAELASGDAEAARLRDRIVGDLAALPEGPDASCLRGLVMLHGATADERTEGKRRVEAALAADPTREEGYEGLAHAAGEDTKEATKRWSLGIAADAGYIPFRLGRASVAAAEAERAMAFGGDPEEACGRAESDLSRVLELDPGRTEALLARGRILRLLADRMGETGGDPEETFEKALKDLTSAVATLPQSAEAHLERGHVHATWGYWMRDQGEDPDERFGKAVEDYDAAISLAPLAESGWRARGDVRRQWARQEKHRGRDPRALYGRALEDYAHALSLDPRAATLWTSRAAVRQGLSVFARVSGEAWKTLLDEATADLGRALELEPRSTWIRRLRAQTGILGAGCLVQDGEDPSKAFEAILEDLDAMIAAQASAPALMERASARVQWAEHEHALGRDPAQLVAAARADLDAAREEGAGLWGFWLELGRLELLEARRGDALAGARRAAQVFTEAIRIHSDATDAHMFLGMARHLEGSALAARGEDPAPAWDAAEESLARALQIHDRWEQVWFRRGRLRLERGDRRGALEDFAQVVTVNPAYVDGWTALAEAKRREGRLDDARSAAERAVSLGPNHAGARLERARVRLELGDRTGAGADLEWIESKVPAWKDEIAGLKRRANGE